MERKEMVRIIIFGIGNAFWSYKDYFIRNSDSLDIVAFIDNDVRCINKWICGVPIHSPDVVKSLEFDGIVILSKKFYTEMAEQLIELGVEQSHIWDFNQIKYQVLKGKKNIYGNDISNNPEIEKVLIISTDMGGSGGTRVAIYAAKVLADMGKEVMLATPKIIPATMEEIMNEHLSVTIWETLPYIYEEDKVWINKFDVVIVNVFQMMNCAYEISRMKPVLWWIHEVKSVWTSYFEDTRKRFPDIDTTNWMNKLNIVGVSEISSKAFNYFYPDMMHRVMSFGIPDKQFICGDEIKGEKIVFAVTADFAEIKGQNILIEALNKICDREKEQIEIWFIGPTGKSMEDLKEICGVTYSVRFFGSLFHEKVMELVSRIDVLVCPSMIESMSMSTIEGMMFSKICITSDMTGIAKYIKNGENGFAFKVGDADDLADRISWVINNGNQWKRIQKAARKTYEEFFSMEKFCEKLCIELEYAKRIYRESRK